MLLKSSWYKGSFTAIILISFVILLTGCGSARRLPEGQALMHKYKIKGLKGSYLEDASSYVRQKPNKKFLGIGSLKVYLGVYNTFNWKHDNRFVRWIRNGLGEPPVIYDSVMHENSAQQIEIYLFNKGFFNAEVSTNTIIKKKKAYVDYQVKAKEPYKIRNIQFTIKDSVLRSIYFLKLNQSKLKIGEIFEQDKVQAERDRITKDLKNYGYFFFNREYIYVDVDSALGKNLVDINLVIENPQNKKAHQSYKINEINVDIAPMPKVKRRKMQKEPVVLGDIKIYDPGRVIKPKIIQRQIFLSSNNSFRDMDLELTYNRLGDLGIFRFVNIDFAIDTLDSTKLNTYIYLTPGNKQGTQTELEGYVAAENIGSSANFTYTNRNIFRGAEIFEFKIRAGVETQAFIDENKQNIPIFNSNESNTSASVTFPGFVFFRDKKTYGIYSSPKTRFGVNYITESRPEYFRTTFSGSFTYDWKQNQFLTHTLSPMTINFVRSNLSAEALDLLNNIDNLYIKESFEPHITLGLRYTLTFSNQILSLKKDYFFIRMNIEVMGTGLYAASKLLDNERNVNGVYQFGGLPYYNFTRPEIDLRYFNFIGKKSVLVYRINTGVGFSYWNSKVLPFERQFFTGGSNSIRAYRARSVGPGGFSDISASNLNLDQTGEMKIEGNIEYRFDILQRFIGSKLKGASFLDFGNIWTISGQSNNPDGQFNWNDFHEELAIGTGFGLRMDYSFLLFRFDLGLKLRDPRFDGSERWVISRINNESWKANNQYGFWNFNFGIGYPF